MHKAQTIAPLEIVLKYKNDDVIHRFMEQYDLPFDEARDIFDETKKWLWVSAHSLEDDQVEGMTIWKEMYVIDEMWHNFILFTKAYNSFCCQYFGQFIHHAPKPKSEKDKYYQLLAENRELAYERIESSMEKQYSFIYDKLGVETLIKWMESYPTRYTSDFLQSIRKHAA